MSKIPLSQTSFYCMRAEKIDEILTKHKDNPLLDYVKDLWTLIDTIEKTRDYDMKMLTACRHKLAWQMYDKDPSEYDPETRTYSDRPSKTGENRSC